MNKKVIAHVTLLLILLGGLGGAFLAKKATGGNWLLGFMLGIELASLPVWLFVFFTKSSKLDKEEED